MPSRRRFLTSLSLAAAAALVGAPRSARAEPPPETTSVRLPNTTWASCAIPPFIAQELLHAEGITDVRYVVPDWDKDMQQDWSEWIARGETDFDFNFTPISIRSMEAGVPIKLLAGLHSGCLELMAHESVRKITDLKGKRVGVDTWSSAAHIFLALMTAYVGLDPKSDIEWVTSQDFGIVAGSMKLFIDGKVDAFLGAPPQPQILRARKIGHSILDNGVDRPWSEYFCCTIAGSADYVSRYPVATKRVLRAVLKAADLCVSQPKWVSRQLVDRGFDKNYDLVFQTLANVRYDRWRDFDIEDTIRFYALRMQELGLSKADPNKIIADSTDWRFINELKREMKS